MRLVTLELSFSSYGVNGIMFELLVKRCPLEPIQNDVRYLKACEIQAQLLEFPDRGEWAQLYLDALSLFIHAYENGLRPNL